MNLTLKNVSAGYGGGDIVKDISFELPDGESLSIVGPNGCGKTTLLRAAAGLLPYKGSVLLGGRELRSLKRREAARAIALLSQISQVYFPYSVAAAVMMGRYAHIKDRLTGTPSRADRECVGRCLEATGLTEVADSDITALSGGQLQRVFLARTLAQEPEIILLDEPTNHLDLKYQAELIEYLKKWAGQGGRSVVGVFHDINLALRLGGRLMVMEGGGIRALGEAEEIIAGGALDEVYGLDVAAYMRESLDRWR